MEDAEEVQPGVLNERTTCSFPPSGRRASVRIGISDGAHSGEACRRTISPTCILMSHPSGWCSQLVSSPCARCRYRSLSPSGRQCRPADVRGFTPPPVLRAVFRTFCGRSRRLRTRVVAQVEYARRGVVRCRPSDLSILACHPASTSFLDQLWSGTCGCRIAVRSEGRPSRSHLTWPRPVLSASRFVPIRG